MTRPTTIVKEAARRSLVAIDHGSRAAWIGRAVCASLDPSEADTIFFGSSVNHDYEQAAKICAACPVVDQCLEDALKNESGGPTRRFGFVGGHTSEERTKLARNRRRQAARQAAKASA